MSQADKQRFITDVMFVAVILAIGYAVLKYLAVWMMPFVIGLVLALILQRPVNWVLRHSQFKRKLVAPAVTLVMVIVVMALLVFALISAVGETAKFVAALPVWFQNTAPDVANAITHRFESILEALPQDWGVQIRQVVRDSLLTMQSQVSTLSAAVLAWVANWAASLPSLLISFIVTLVATFFLCSEFNEVKGFLWKQIPQKYEQLAGDTWITFAHTVGQMLRSYLLIMFVTFCQLAVGLTLLRVDYPVLLAALISMVDILPVLGTGTILIPWGLIALLTGKLSFGFGILFLYMIVTIVRNILEPRIVGRRIGVHPLVTLALMYLGLHILGAPGMFLFPLIFLLLKNAQETGVIRLWKE